MRILDVVARWPGSCQNYVIWKNSALRNMFEMGFIPDKHYLVGNKEYPTEPWLLTPFEEANTPRLKKFNTLHKNALSIIQNCFHLLKSRFRCLGGHKFLYAPDKVCKIVLACCILHNICLKYNIENDLEDELVGDSCDVEESELLESVSPDIVERGALVRMEVASQL